MQIKFNDCINNQSPYLNFCENYLFNPEFSKKGAYQKFEIVSEDKTNIKLKKAKQEVPLTWKKVALTIVKIVSYVIFPILLAIALISKTIYRHTHTFEILDPSKIKPNPSLNLEKVNEPENQPIALKNDSIPISNELHERLRLTNNEWFYSDQIHDFFDYFEEQHRHLYCCMTDIRPMTSFLPTIQNSIEQAKNLKKKALAFNVNINKLHWTLIYVDIQTQTVEYYDSMKNFGLGEDLKKFLTDVTLLLNQEYPTEKPFNLIYKIKEATQFNSFDCGPWILYFLENRAKDPSVDFNTLNKEMSQKIMSDYRLEIMTKLNRRHAEGIPLMSIHHDGDFSVVMEYVNQRRDKDRLQNLQAQDVHRGS